MAIEINSNYDFSACPYIPMRHRIDGQTGVVFGRALVHSARSVDRDWISSWLSQPAIHRALGMRHAPSQRNVDRSQLPDGSGNLESVEFLALHDITKIRVAQKWAADWLNGLSQPAGFYLVYDSRRARSQEVDFAFSPDFLNQDKAISVPLLRAGRIATLGYLMAVCGADRVQWVRRRKVPGTSTYRTRGPVRVVNIDKYISTLHRLEPYKEVPTVINNAK